MQFAYTHAKIHYTYAQELTHIICHLYVLTPTHAHARIDANVNRGI